MVDPTSFKERFPEFSTVADARVQLFIDDAVVVLNEVYWGSKYDLGVSYYSAHCLTLGKNSESGSTSPPGVVSGKSVDGVSISYSSPPISDMTESIYGSTVYGQRYLALRKTLGVPVYVV